MKHLILAVALLAGCANMPGGTVQVGASPEAQIATGAQTVTATATLATVLLRNRKITVPQAKSFHTMLSAAGESLTDANGELLQCRSATGSTDKTSPDPCWPKVADVVKLALDNIAGVKKALEAK